VFIGLLDSERTCSTKNSTKVETLSFDSTVLSLYGLLELAGKS
jgi:hypothetical protein